MNSETTVQLLYQFYFIDQRAKVVVCQSAIVMGGL